MVVTRSWLWFGFVIVAACNADSFTPCAIKDDKCLAKSIEAALRSLKNGNPQYGLTALDPLPIKALTINAGSSTVKLVQNYKDVQLTGFSDGTIQKAHFDQAKKNLLFKGTYPKLVQRGHYTIDGKLLSLPVTGDGPSSLELQNVEILTSIDFDEIQKGGKTYLKIKSFLLDITPKKMIVNFENLFNGNKLLGDNINKVINEEWDAVYNDVKVSTQENYADIWKKYAEPLFEKVPVDEMFLK